MNYLNKVFILLITLSLLACGSARLTEDNTPNQNIDLNTTGFASSLADLLRKQPGVRVDGVGDNVNVIIRGGTNSIELDTRPLYVINGVQLGNDYKQANHALDINTVDRIEIKKGTSQTTLYGGAGINGVIEIYTSTYTGKKRKKSS